MLHGARLIRWYRTDGWRRLRSCPATSLGVARFPLPPWRPSSPPRGRPPRLGVPQGVGCKSSGGARIPGRPAPRPGGPPRGPGRCPARGPAGAAPPPPPSGPGRIGRSQPAMRPGGWCLPNGVHRSPSPWGPGGCAARPRGGLAPACRGPGRGRRARRPSGEPSPPTHGRPRLGGGARALRGGLAATLPALRPVGRRERAAVADRLDGPQAVLWWGLCVVIGRGRPGAGLGWRRGGEGRAPDPSFAPAGTNGRPCDARRF